MSSKKRFILSNISNLHTHQKKELVDMINETNINYMENNYGIFVELNDISEEYIDKIYNFIEFCITQKPEKIETEEEKNFSNLEFFIEQNKVKEVIVIKKPEKIEEYIEKPTHKNITLKDYETQIITLSKQKVI